MKDNDGLPRDARSSGLPPHAGGYVNQVLPPPSVGAVLWMLPHAGGHVRAEDAPQDVLSAAVVESFRSVMRTDWEELVARLVRDGFEIERRWWRGLPTEHPARDVARRALLDAGFTEDEFADWLAPNKQAEPA